jgi:TRAP-type uncharacterized transport system substrate-binding protein
MTSYFVGRVRVDGKRNDLGRRPNIGRAAMSPTWRSGTRWLRACTAVAVLGGIGVCGQVYAGAESLRAPAGMVPYSHPVVRNGKRILWHGAWRGKAGHESAQRAPAKVAIVEQPPPQPQAPVAKLTPQSQVVKPFSILADPDDLTASEMARDFGAVLSDKGAPGRAIVGSTSPNGLAKAAKSDMADFAIVTLDSMLASAKLDADWPKHAPLIARLAPETMEVIAPREIKSVADLQGKRVSVGDPDSATVTSARLLFSRFGISVAETLEPLTEGLDALSSGKRDAVVALGARDSHAIGEFGEDGKYHLVAIPWAPNLESAYTPARVASADRPNLVPANETVETVAEPLALIALDAAAGSPRAEAAGRVARSFFESYDAFLSDDRAAEWRDINLAADPSIPNLDWPRLVAAQGWLDERKPTTNASLDAFRASAKTAADAGGGPKAEDSDRLYDDLTRWRSLMQ